MRIRRISLLIIIILSITFSYADSKDELDSFILEKMKDADKPGLSAAVIKNGEIVWNKAYGYADLENKEELTEDTPLIAGSISKTVVAVAAMQLFEKGSLDLDADCNIYLPFKVRNPNYPDIPITVKMLFTHTSSLKSNWFQVMYGLLQKGDPEMGLGKFCKAYCESGGKLYYKGNYENFEPGTKFEYSNPAVTLLAYIVEQVSGMDFESYCRTNIFAPLDMQNSSWFYKNLSNRSAVPYEKGFFGLYWNRKDIYSAPYYPCGFLKTTSVDYAKFLCMIINRGTYKNTILLKPESVIALLEIQPNIHPEHWDKIGLIFQYNNINGRNFIGHTGGLWGVSGLAYFNPETDTGVVMLMNGGWQNFFQFDRLKEKPTREIFLRLFGMGETL